MDRVGRGSVRLFDLTWRCRSWSSKSRKCWVGRRCSSGRSGWTRLRPSFTI